MQVTQTEDSVSTIVPIPLAQIRTDGGTQPRTFVDAEAVEDYADAMANGAVFPPLDVFYDGTDYWLAHGFHRATAAKQVGLTDFPCEVHQGTVEDARWFSFGVNKTNGLRRTNADKQRAVEAALRHPKSVGFSDHQIANHVGVDVKTIGNWRERLSMEIPQIDSRTVTRNGTTYQQNVANIGKRSMDTIGIVPLSDPPGLLANGIARCACGKLYDADRSSVCPYCVPQQAGDKEHDRLAVHFSSASEEWYTPPEIIGRTLNVLDVIDLDPCSNTGEPNVPAQAHYTQEHDGLNRMWGGRVYMNPPYGRGITEWVEKLCDEHLSGRVTEAIALVPARVDTDWFRLFRDYAVCFIDGRLKFSGHENSAPFPSAVVYLGTDIAKFNAAFEDLGDIWVRWSK